MRVKIAAAVGCVWALVLVAGCEDEPGLCERAQRVTAPAGECEGLRPVPLGDAAACANALPACAAADEEAALTDYLSCYEKLPACQTAAQESWTSQAEACRAPLSRLSQSCRRALFGEGQTPDGGSADAGLDAGLDADRDGGGVVDLVAVADEDAFAVAWVQGSPGSPSSWALHLADSTGAPLPGSRLPAGARGWMARDAGPGSGQSFFVAGLDADGGLALSVLATEVTVDAGPVACRRPLDCPEDRVCDLGQCVPLSCRGEAECPAGHACDTISRSVCLRMAVPSGSPEVPPAFDAGVAGRPLLSEQVEAQRGPPSFSPSHRVGQQPLNDLDLAGIDSARQVMAGLQDLQAYSFSTQDRGQSWRRVLLDPLGQRVRLLFEPSREILYACYNLGPKVRVRRSFDFGASWDPAVGDIVGPSDGGLAARVQDCDLALWRDGKVMLVTVDDYRQVNVRTVGSDLQVSAPETVFVGSVPDGGAIFDPQRPAIATLPETSTVQVGFTGWRVASLGYDSEVFGSYRSSASGGSFSPASRISAIGAVSQSGRQDNVTLALDARSGLGFAAYTSGERTTSSIPYETVYMSVFGLNPTSPGWAASSDLTVFAQHPTSKEYLVLPDRPSGTAAVWSAFSPSLAVTPAGRIFLGFAAGQKPTAGQSARYAPYLVEFDPERLSPLSLARAWYVAPARKAAPEAVLDASSTSGFGPAISSDGQLSVYLGYLEGTGPSTQTAGLPVFVSRP